MVGLKTLVFSILVPGTVAVIIPWLLLQGTGGLVLPALSLWMVGLLPLLLGVGLYVWCAGAFTFIGKGTPAPIDAPRVFVEEPSLRRRFGASYETYVHTVPRWLPRFTRR